MGRCLPRADPWPKRYRVRCPWKGSLAYCQSGAKKSARWEVHPQQGAPISVPVRDRPPDTKGGMYGREYFNWQKTVGAFGGVANMFKSRNAVPPTDTVVDLGCGGGYLGSI